MAKSSSKPKRKVYPLAQTTFTKAEYKAAKSVLDKGRLTMGEEVKAFEKEFAAWTGSKYALMVNSGSSANLLMVEALVRKSRGIPPLKTGDEVLVPALSWPTTVWPLLQLGLRPVFVDIDPITLSIDLASAEASLSPKTKAIALIHVLGQAAEMKPIINFCRQNKLVLLEDVCESLGAHSDRRHAGTFGAMGSFSCYFSHHISTIEGGVVITSDEDLYNDLKSMRSHGWIRDRSDKNYWTRQNPDIDPRFMFITAGYNVRPTEIQAAIGRVQLKKLDDMLNARECLAFEVDRLARLKTPWMRLVGAQHFKSAPNPNRIRRARTNSWMTLPFLISNKARVSVDQVKNLFEQMGIETRPIIAGNLARHPAARAYNIRTAASLSNSDSVLRNGFMIGCHPTNWKKNISYLEAAFSRAAKL